MPSKFPTALVQLAVAAITFVFPPRSIGENRPPTTFTGYGTKSGLPASSLASADLPSLKTMSKQRK
jgi:hypothetical protein